MRGPPGDAYRLSSGDYAKEALNKLDFVVALSLLTKNISLHITHMLRRYFLFAPCLT